MKRNTGSQRRYLRGTVGQMLVACVVAGALLLLFGWGGCSSSSSPSTELAVGATDDTPEVPLIFTIQTDTAEGIRMVYAAQGARLALIGQSDLVRIGEANCRHYAERRLGLSPEKGHFAGAVAFHSSAPAAEPIILCWFDKTYTRAEVEGSGQKMLPPRKVMQYDPATRTVTFGPNAMLPT